MPNVKTLSLRDRDVQITALSFEQLDALQDDVASLLAGFSWAESEKRASLLRVMSASTGLSDAELSGALDISNAVTAVMTVFGANGFVSKEPGEQGEVPAAPSVN